MVASHAFKKTTHGCTQATTHGCERPWGPRAPLAPGPRNERHMCAARHALAGQHRGCKISCGLGAGRQYGCCAESTGSPAAGIAGARQGRHQHDRRMNRALAGARKPTAQVGLVMGSGGQVRGGMRGQCTRQIQCGPRGQSQPGQGRAREGLAPRLRRKSRGEQGRSCGQMRGAASLF